MEPRLVWLCYHPQGGVPFTTITAAERVTQRVFDVHEPLQVTLAYLTICASHFIAGGPWDGGRGTYNDVVTLILDLLSVVEAVEKRAPEVQQYA